MKKALLLLATVLTTMAASAQFEIGLGGSFGIPGHKSYVGGTEDKLDLVPYRSSFSITPTIGFRINDAMSVGAYIEFSQTKDHNPWVAVDANNNQYRVDNVSAVSLYGAAPFFRYNVVSYGDIRIFFELQAHINFGSMTNKDNDNGSWVDIDEYKLTAMRFNIAPGASYQITDHISFDVFFNFASLGYSMMSSTHTKTILAATGKFGDIESSDQVKNTYSIFGFNNSFDYLDYNNSTNFHLGAPIAVKLNVTF